MSLYGLETQLELQVHELYDAHVVLENCNIYLITTKTSLVRIIKNFF
jgi:hypothetical protein